MRRLVAQGIRGVTSNPTIIAKAIGSSADYDGQLAALTAAGRDAEASYWALVTSDLNGALAVLRPIYDRTQRPGLQGTHQRPHRRHRGPAPSTWLPGRWTEPDDGIWEVRGGRRHFVASKVMAWVAVDRAIRWPAAWACPPTWTAGRRWRAPSAARS